MNKLVVEADTDSHEMLPLTLADQARLSLSLLKDKAERIQIQWMYRYMQLGTVFVEPTEETHPDELYLAAAKVTVIGAAVLSSGFVVMNELTGLGFNPINYAIAASEYSFK